MNVRNTLFAVSVSTLAVAAAQAQEPKQVPQQAQQQQAATQPQAIPPQPQIWQSRRDRRRGTQYVIQTTPPLQQPATQPKPAEQKPPEAQQQAAPPIQPTIQQPPIQVDERRPGPLSRLFGRLRST